jgi:hypothetical protein
MWNLTTRKNRETTTYTPRRPSTPVSRNRGKTYKVTGTLKQGIDGENAKKINKLIRDEVHKNVKTQIQGDNSASPARSATTCRLSSPCSEGRPRRRVAVRRLPLSTVQTGATPTESARYVKIVHWHRRQQGVIANR